MPWLATVTALAVLGFTIAILYSGLKRDLHQQLARRDAQILAALLERQVATSTPGEDAWLLALVEASASPQLPGVESLLLFDSGGKFFTSLYGTNRELALDPDVLARVQADRLAFNFEPPSIASQLPILRVTTALRDEREPGRILAFAEFQLDASDLALELAKMDRRLALQAGATFAIAGSILVLTLAWSFSELGRANRELSTQSNLLRESNRRLLLAAKTGAVGALAANLVHGLKNPLAALQNSLAGLGQTAGFGPEVDDARSSTRRIRNLIDEVVRILREDSESAGYDASVGDLFATIRRRIQAIVNDKEITFIATGEESFTLPHRSANIALLILENLLTNAIEASPNRTLVTIQFELGSTGLEYEFTVSDSGPGLPDGIRTRLFVPLVSSKPGGSGLGLALSHQLALQLGGELALVRSDPGGTAFKLRLPREVRN